MELTYTKKDVILSHLYSSLQMISIECHPFSIHVVVMACKEIIIDVARESKLFIEWDPKIWIKEQHYTQYLRLEKKSYNYFKHANRDAYAEYDGPKIEDLIHLNKVQTLFNIYGFYKIALKLEPALNEFISLMMIEHPQYFRVEFLDEHPNLKEQFANLDRSPQTVMQALQFGLFNRRLLPRIPPR